MSVPPRSTKMAAQPFLHEFKKQASFFLKEKIKTARLALTDVTPAQLLAEEATSGSAGSPDTRTLKTISRAAFEIDDYWRIVEILHKRLARFERKNWRASYQAVIVLEHLMTHGPESVAEEFKADQDVIAEMGNFQFIDEKGFNWGLSVRKKLERVLKLLQNGELLKEERNKARKITRGIQGFGSFSLRNYSAQEVAQKSYGKCNSLFNENGEQEDESSSSSSLESKPERSVNKMENPAVSWSDFHDSDMPGRMSSKENMDPEDEIREEMHEWSSKGESNLLLSEQRADSRINNFQDEDHPFTDEPLTKASLLLSSDRVLQAY